MGIKWLRIELTNACNFNCAYCAEQYMTRKKGFMDMSLAKKIINEISETHISDVLGLQFMGEGLLHPKFDEIASYAKDRGVKLHLTTNAGLLTDKNIDSILDHELKSVYLSLFTPDEHSYSLRGGANKNYEDYERGVKNLIREKFKRKSGIKISIGLLNTQYCFLPGIDAVKNNDKARRLVYSWFSPINEDISITFVEVGTWANQLLVKRGVKVTPNEKGFCPSPFEQLFIAWDGTCTPCCLDYDCNIKVGDANRDSIASIWNNDRYKRIREGMNNNLLIEPYCQTCRGKINLFSFLRRSDIWKLLRMGFSREKLQYICARGWRRFKLI